MWRIRDPGSWFLPIPDTGSRISDTGSRISDPGSQNSNKREGWKFFFCNCFLFSNKFHKIEHYIFWFWKAEEKNLGQFSKNFFYPKNCHLALKHMGLGSGIRDPGSGKNLLRIPDPGVKKAPDPGSGSATLIQIVQTLKNRTKTYSGSRIQGSKRHRIPDPDPQHWYKLCRH